MRSRLRHWRFDGTATEPLTRIYFDRGDSVGVLLYDPQQDAVILIRQFRYPVYAGLDPEQRADGGIKKAWLLEIVAGMVDEGLTVTEVANRELLEEAGFVVKDSLRPIAAVYVAAEGEDIEVVVLPFREAMKMVASGEICDAKTIIALQHLALLKAETADMEASS
jgi:ADP-ribose pyrophosphatase